LRTPQAWRRLLLLREGLSIVGLRAGFVVRSGCRRAWIDGKQLPRKFVVSRLVSRLACAGEPRDDEIRHAKRRSRKTSFTHAPAPARVLLQKRVDHEDEVFLLRLFACQYFVVSRFTGTTRGRILDGLYHDFLGSCCRQSRRVCSQSGLRIPLGGLRCCSPSRNRSSLRQALAAFATTLVSRWRAKTYS